MRCVVTAGPTYEAVDHVRRLTNASTGRLGTELADFLAAAGHEVCLLRGIGSTAFPPQQVRTIDSFGTSEDLGRKLEALRLGGPEAVLHAAAVSDFRVGRVWQRLPGGELREFAAAKIPTSLGTLVAELIPTEKVIGRLRAWFPSARLIGWKFEVDGDRTASVTKGRQLMAGNRLDGCVVNGPAYGDGFGLVDGQARLRHLATRPALYAALAAFLEGGGF